jgi:hypothetical protein
VAVMGGAGGAQRLVLPVKTVREEQRSSDGRGRGQSPPFGVLISIKRQVMYRFFK